MAREKAKGNDIYTFLLHKFSDLKLTDKSFDKKGFDLQEYTNQSFGVYHGEVLNVELLFNEELSQEASKYNFHPTQAGKFNDDGTLSKPYNLLHHIENLTIQDNRHLQNLLISA